MNSFVDDSNEENHVKMFHSFVEEDSRQDHVYLDGNGLHQVIVVHQHQVDHWIESMVYWDFVYSLRRRRRRESHRK